MKYIGILILASSLFVTSHVSAKELTVLGVLQSHETRATSFKLQKGTTSLEVFSSYDNTKLTCEFVDGAGNVGLVQRDVPRCVGNVKLNADDSMSVRVTNNSDKAIDYRIIVRGNS